VAGSGGSFTIQNAGGGQLSGHILPRLQGLDFSPSQWTGNNQVITYTLSQSGAEELSNILSRGISEGQDNESQSTSEAAANHIKSQAYISSTGGETTLPITITSAPMTIQTDEGPTISSTQDFYNYAQSHPAAARRLFTSSEFYMLLLSTNYPHMEIYEILHKDVNRERALDNFFMLSGQKSKTQLTLETQKLGIVLKPAIKTQAKFYVKKSDSGYADAPIIPLSDSPWLSLSTTRLASSDYDKENRAEIGITIDPAHMPSPFVRAQIQIGPEPIGSNVKYISDNINSADNNANHTNNILDLTVRRAAPFTLRLPRVGYRYEDRGSIEIENNTGSDMTIEVYSRDRYVRFYANTYVIGTAHSIPFEIRPTAFASAQRLFRSLPYISTYVDVRAHCPGQVFHRRLYLTIGEW